MQTLLEFLAFIRHRRAFWLVPSIILLLLVAALVIFAPGSALAPFIYTLF